MRNAELRACGASDAAGRFGATRERAATASDEMSLFDGCKWGANGGEMGTERGTTARRGGFGAMY